MPIRQLKLPNRRHNSLPSNVLQISARCGHFAIFGEAVCRLRETIDCVNKKSKNLRKLSQYIVYQYVGDGLYCMNLGRSVLKKSLPFCPALDQLWRDNMNIQIRTYFVIMNLLRCFHLNLWILFSSSYYLPHSSSEKYLDTD